jgi:hypothetical protein
MLLPVVAAGFLSPAAQAQNTFRVYAGLAPTTYNIEFDNNAPAGYRSKTAKSNYLATNVGVSWISPQRIYVDLSAQQSGSATHDLWKDIPAGPDQHFSHDSWALTAGYVHVLSQGMTISGFGGYRLGKTTLGAPKGATIPADGTLTWSEDVFKSKGVFFGAAWGMPALRGTINLSGALAFLGGTWSNDSTTNPYGNDAKATVGFSFNAGYTYRFGQGWGVTGDYRFQTYKYGFNQFTTGATTNPAYNVTERISSIGARVSYEF